MFAMLVFAGVVHAQSGITFMKAVEQTSVVYEKAVAAPEIRDLELAGRRSTVTGKLKELVPEGKKTAADFFVLANMLYKADPSASSDYMKQAEHLLPHEPAIWFERALREHRAGNCQQAMTYYNKFHKAAMGKEHFVSWAYSAHCLLVLGDARGALTAWSNANFRRHHVGIESAMYEIFSDKDPDTEREKLFAEIGSHAVDALCELVYLDTHWERDWWNVATSAGYLAHDIEYGNNVLKSDPLAAAQFSLCHTIKSLNAEDFTSRVTTAGYWGDTHRLPDSPTLTYLLVQRLIELDMAKPDDVLLCYEDQLVTRLHSQPSDKRTRHLLAYLYSATKNLEKLAPIDVQGWKMQHMQNYAESYMLRKQASESGYQALLTQAISDFPNSAILAQLRYRTAEDPLQKLRYLMDLTAAEFANVAFTDINDGLSLDDFMHGMAREIANAKVPENSPAR